MMCIAVMFVNVENRVYNSIHEMTWHIDQKKPQQVIFDDFEKKGIDLESYNIKVINIQADGDELEYIEKNFSNLPMKGSSRTVTWSGDLAQFIFDNL